MKPLGLDRENALVFWLVILFTALLFLSNYWSLGNVPLVAFILYMTGVVILSFLRLDLSLYLLMAAVMFLDQYPVPGFVTMTEELSYFSNLKEISYIPFFEAGMVSPAEIHLIAIVLSTLLQLILRVNVIMKPIPVFLPFLGFLGAIIFSVLRGLKGGGDFMVSLWEIRALFYLSIIFVTVPHIISSKQQVVTLVWIFITGTVFKSLQGIKRFIELGFTTGGLDVLTNHEDAVFIVTILLLLIGFMVFGVRNGQRRFILISMLFMMLGFYVAQRRAAYASMIVSVALLILLLPAVKRMQFLKFFIPTVVVLLVYGAAFWNSNSTLAGPVQTLKSGFEKPSLETNARDYYSNLYREFENYNLAYTVAKNPVWGVGFGKRYEQPIPLAQIRFSLKDYIPHNQIFWIIVKTGTVGFLAFWFFFNAFVAKSVRLFMRVDDPYFKALLLMISLAVINQMVVSFFDLQLTYYRNMLYLGCLMALVPSIEYIWDKEGKDHKKNEEEAGDEDQ
ncbi:O-antigen ligase family protein [Gracilimonas tropica]|uniref:O-antigen ligase family protein n=1 Tax=Gracilimonas tropica TaxID=454600 RepID=UPI00039F32AE|nr:O-antigen ligase family protein [Gracilimonas tropica]